ncbi:MAG: ABC transporter ATP-binding protein [Desulfobacterales bacterium]|nr:ABC transporter ATP-binding protein [Desulfobacterales bacterium]
MIHLKNVTKYYEVKGKRSYILKGATFSIPTGKNLGILGRNGAGKSTLLRMLGGIDFPNAGKIESNLRFSWPLGLVGGFQGSLTGKENVKFVCRFYGKTPGHIRTAVSFVKEFSELGDYFDMPIKTYSSGMKARLGFALSFAFNFDCYLIDEVLSVGDRAFRAKSAKAVKDLKGRSTIFLVSHDMNTLKKMCDAGVYLENGMLTYFDDIKDAVAAYQKD